MSTGESKRMDDGEMAEALNLAVASKASTGKPAEWMLAKAVIGLVGHIEHVRGEACADYADLQHRYNALREDFIALANTKDEGAYVIEALALREVVDNLVAAAREARKLFLAYAEEHQRTGQALKAARNFEAAAKLFAAIEKAGSNG